MSVDFTKDECQTNLSDEQFGIRDTPPAYPTIDNPDLWIATVSNPDRKDIRFTAVDKCIDNFRADGNEESSCDCILSYENNIVFIELKEKVRAWMNSGIEQLEKTIEIYDRDHGLHNFSRRRAFVANRRHPNFQVIDIDIKQKLFQTYRVRVMAEASILIN